METILAPTEEAFLKVLQDFTRPYRTSDMVAHAMRLLMDKELADLPLPGSGQTLDRWRALAAVAAIDLSLAKIYEGHTDAIAILSELRDHDFDGLWAVWAAESPSARVIFHPDQNGGTLEGTKAWCSGAADVDNAIVSAWNEHGKPVVARVNMHQPDVEVKVGGWEAVGMAAAASVTVIFRGARASQLGTEGDYVARPGFWQGGAGIAAVWYGGAVAIARELLDSSRVSSDPHAAAHLGAVDVALNSARSLLVETAGWIDENPTSDASMAALRVRTSVEAAANEVLLRTGRALGAGPLCMNAIHAQRCADLSVFLRQSHAESDLAALGRGACGDDAIWDL